MIKSVAFNIKQLTHLVSARVLIQDHLAFLEEQTSLLCKEKIGAFHDVLEMGFALVVNKCCNVRYIDCFRTGENRNSDD
jgi:hypothetical protein